MAEETRGNNQEPDEGKEPRPLPAPQNQNTAPVNRSYNLSGLRNSISSIKRGLDMSSLRFSSELGSAAERVTNLESQIAATNQQLQITQADFRKSIQIIQGQQIVQKSELLVATQAIVDIKNKQLLDQQAEERRIKERDADLRRQRNEERLEKKKSSIFTDTKKTLDAVAKGSFNPFNIIGALKDALGLLTAGLVISNMDVILDGIGEISKSWKRIVAVWIRSTVRGIARFFAALWEQATRLGARIGEIYDAVKTQVRRFGNFLLEQGNKAFKFTKKFLTRLVNSGKDFLKRLRNAAAAMFRPFIDWSKKGAQALADLLGIRRPGATATPTPNPSSATPDGSSAVDDVVDAGADAAGATKPRGNWIQRFGGMVGDLSQRAYQGVQDFTGLSFEGVENFVKKTFDQAKGLTSGVFSQIQGFTGNITNAAKQGPEALGKVWTQFMSSMGGVVGRVAPLLDSALLPIFRAIAPFGEKGIKMVQRIGRSSMALALPLDYMINKFFFGQDTQQAFTRAVGSSIGSLIGGAAGTFTGIPGMTLLGGVAGGEAGDLLAATLSNQFLGTDYSTEENLIIQAQNLINWLNSTPNKEEGVEAPAAAIPTATPTPEESSASKIMIEPQTSAIALGERSSLDTRGPDHPVINVTGEGSDNEAAPSVQSISPASTGASTESMKISETLRKKSELTKGGGGGTQVATTTLPPQTIQVPGQTIGNVTGGATQGEANPLPSIASNNESTLFYETFAASQYRIQLV